jgi:hypothetical protein
MTLSLSALVRALLLSIPLIALSVDGAHALQATVRWADTSSRESGFQIERRVSTAKVYAPIGGTAANITSFVDPNLLASTTYCYHVRAYNTGGTSAYSTEVCVTTPVQKVRLSASLLGNGTLTASPAGINCPTACTADYAAGTQVTLTPRAGSGATFAGWGGACTGQGPTCVLTMAATTNVTATFAVVPSQMRLTWADTSSRESGFKIERKVGTTGTYAEIALTAANITSFSDPELLASTTYCYRVRAYNTGGTSAYSNEMCGTTR